MNHLRYSACGSVSRQKTCRRGGPRKGLEGADGPRAVNSGKLVSGDCCHINVVYVRRSAETKTTLLKHCNLTVSHIQTSGWQAPKYGFGSNPANGIPHVLAATDG